MLLKLSVRPKKPPTRKTKSALIQMTHLNADEIVAQLRQRDLTIATAESLTAGMLSSAIADVPGASAVLQGGVVAYNNTIKHRILGVSADTLAARGAVDIETAKQMRSEERRVG